MARYKTSEVSVGKGRPSLTKEEVEKLCEECRQYAEKETSLTIEGFALSKRLTPPWANAIAADYPEFRQAYEYCRFMVGKRREEGALKKSMSETLVVRTMPLYNKEFKDYMYTMAKLNSESEKTINFIAAKRPDLLEKEEESAS